MLPDLKARRSLMEPHSLKAIGQRHAVDMLSPAVVAADCDRFNSSSYWWYRNPICGLMRSNSALSYHQITQQSGLVTEAGRSVVQLSERSSCCSCTLDCKPQAGALIVAAKQVTAVSLSCSAEHCTQCQCHWPSDGLNGFGSYRILLNKHFHAPLDGQQSF